MKSSSSVQRGFVWLPVLLGVFAVLAVSGGAWWYGHRTTTPQLAQNQEATTTPAETINWKTYTNTKFGYSIKYPSGWIVEPEKQIVDESNKIYSSVQIHESTNLHSISVQVDGREWLLKHETPQTAQITANGSAQTAYIFSNGYECYDARPGDDCSFFVVPILSNGMWYELHANKDAKTVIQLYKDIFSTFKITGNSSQTISVPGMSKYTDADFGFSFWYPTSWTVKNNSTPRNNDGGGTVKKSLIVSPPPDPAGMGGGSIYLDEFYSPTREIATPEDMCSPMQGYVIPAKRYYFDTNLRTWMVETSAATNSSERDGSQSYTPTTTKAADVSVNTMGGLHEFSSGCAGEVIPLSAHNFLIFSYSHIESPWYYSYFSKTIVATDPAVATPIDVAKQEQIITIVGKLLRGERDAYQVKGWLDKSGSDWILKEATKDGTGRTGSVFTLHFNDKSTCTYKQADYHNDTTFVCLGGLKPWGAGDRVVVSMDDVFSSDITVRWMYVKSALPISNW